MSSHAHMDNHTASPTNQPSGSYPRKVVVLCDGSYCRKTGAAGWAASVRVQHVGRPPKPAHVLSGADHRLRDNNEAELVALQRSVEWLLPQPDLAGCEVVVYTDSTYVREHIKADPLHHAGAAKVELCAVKAHQGVRSPLAAAHETLDRLAKREMRVLRETLLRMKADEVGCS